MTVAALIRLHWQRLWTDGGGIGIGFIHGIGLRRISAASWAEDDEVGSLPLDQEQFSLAGYGI